MVAVVVVGEDVVVIGGVLALMDVIVVVDNDAEVIGEELVTVVVVRKLVAVVVVVDADVAVVGAVLALAELLLLLLSTTTWRLLSLLLWLWSLYSLHLSWS